MTDPVPAEDPKGTKWLWVGVLVLLAVATIIFFLNADGDEELETIPDEAITTTEERLNTEITPGDTEGLPPVDGMDDTGAMDEGEATDDAPEPLPTPEDTPLAETQ